VFETNRLTAETGDILFQLHPEKQIAYFYTTYEGFARPRRLQFMIRNGRLFHISVVILGEERIVGCLAVDLLFQKLLWA
jgi:hypothetical protein